MKTTDFITEGIAEDADEMHRDHEVQMARADCYNAAKYAIELHKLLHKIAETQGLDGWVSEKITLANDYLRTVHEYLTHEMAQGQQDTVIIPEFSFESANAKFNRLVNEGVAEGVTSPEIKQAYKDVMNTTPGTSDRKSAVKKYQKLRADALDKKRKEQDVAEGSNDLSKYNDYPETNQDPWMPVMVGEPSWKNIPKSLEIWARKKGIHRDIQIRHDPDGRIWTIKGKGYPNNETVYTYKWLYNTENNKFEPIPDEQGVAEGSEFGAYYYEQLAQQVFNTNPNLTDENEILNLGYKIAKGELGSRAQGIFRDEDFPSDFVTAYGYLKKQGVNEVSDETLTSYLTKVDTDSQKHEKDPTKRSAEKRNKSVAGFSRAFNKLDARKEKVDEIDPNNYDSDEDYYRDLEAQNQRNGGSKRPYNPDWDADDEEFMQKWYEKHGLAEKETNEAQYDRGDYYSAKLGGEYGRSLTTSNGGGGSEGYRGAHKKSGLTKKLPSDPFGRTTGKIPDSAKPKKELDPFRDVNESASAGGTGAGSIATAIASVSSKPGTGKPKKVGNMISRKKPQIGKGIY